MIQRVRAQQHPMPKAEIELILLSGGIESTTLLYMQRHSALRALFIDYGQRAATQERRAAEYHSAAMGVPLQVLDMSAVGEAFRADREQRLHVPLPHRNLVALALGLSYAEHIGAACLYLALNREDTVAYPSASEEFIGQVGQLASLLGRVKVETPLIHLSKAEIIRQGRGCGVDYARTYSCLLGYERHCGACPQCRNRRQAFSTACLEEPAGFYRHA